MTNLQSAPSGGNAGTANVRPRPDQVEPHQGQDPPGRIAYTFDPVPSELRTDPRLKPLDHVVVGALLELAYWNGRRDSCWGTVATIARRMPRHHHGPAGQRAYCARTVQRSLRNLIACGWIERRSVGSPDPDDPRNRTGYRIHFRWLRFGATGPDRTGREPRGVTNLSPPSDEPPGDRPDAGRAVTKMSPDKNVTQIRSLSLKTEEGEDPPDPPERQRPSPAPPAGGAIGRALAVIMATRAPKATGPEPPPGPAIPEAPATVEAAPGRELAPPAARAVGPRKVPSPAAAGGSPVPGIEPEEGESFGTYWARARPGPDPERATAPVEPSPAMPDPGTLAPAQRDWLSGLGPEDRARFDRSSAGKRREMLEWVGVGMPDLATRELARVREGPLPGPAREASVREHLAALADPRRLPAEVVPRAAEALMRHLGDNGNSFNYFNRKLYECIKDNSLLQEIIRLLGELESEMTKAARGERPPIGNPAGYYTGSLGRWEKRRSNNIYK